MQHDDEEAPLTPNAPTSRRRLLAGALAGVGYAGLSLSTPASARAAPEVSPPALSRGPLLKSLLQRNHELRPEYRGGLSNHLSMGLYSLSALGGSSAQLQRFAESQWPALEALPKQPGPGVTRENWSRWLGKAEALNGFRAFFAAEILRLGRAAALHRYLPRLLPGIAAGAFHPLIRTAYGVRFGDDQEVADGLSYWATAFLPLGPLGLAGRERDPRVLFAQIHERPTLAGLDLPGRLITGRMRAAAALPDFAAAVDALSPSDGGLAGIAALVARLYLQSGDFTALHAVTGTHAYRLLSPYVEPPAEGFRYFWQALAAAYISVGAPRLLEPPASPTPAWEPTLRQASTSLDAHDLKLVDIAHEEESFYKDGIYRRAAARRLNLL
jgi:Questin oxidase-like